MAFDIPFCYVNYFCKLCKLIRRTNGDAENRGKGEYRRT